MLDMEIDNSAVSIRTRWAVCKVARQPLIGLRLWDIAGIHDHAPVTPDAGDRGRPDGLQEQRFEGLIRR